MKRENYIFLDIDGVLNSYNTKVRGPYNCPGIDSKHLNVLVKIIEETKGKVVLISDWRLSFLPDDHMPKMAEYITKRLNSKNINFELVSHNHNYEVRAKEIKKWIENYPTKGYIILDDMEYKEYYKDSIKPHWVYIEDGLTKKHISEAINKMKIKVEQILL